MPVCYITLSELVPLPSIEEINIIRDIISENLRSSSRVLDRNHIVVRIQQGERKFMLGELEIEIFAQLYFDRFFTRDKRAKIISQKISKLLSKDCATWITLGMVGYSRVTSEGEVFFSD